MSTTITKYIEIDMGHRIPNHKSKCRNLHGHRYRIEVCVSGDVIDLDGQSDEGMVIDFSDVKNALMKIDELYDHSCVVYHADEYIGLFEAMKDDDLKINIVGFIPTAENLAQHWYYFLKNLLEDNRIKVEWVKVYETPTSTAMYA